jgi:hypothetical protein
MGVEPNAFEPNLENTSKYIDDLAYGPSAYRFVSKSSIDFYDVSIFDTDGSIKYIIAVGSLQQVES